MENSKKLSILCLHGKRQTASIFREKVLKWVQKIEDIASCDFLDAPFELPLEHESDMVAMRTWGSRSTSTTTTTSYLDAVSVIQGAQERHPYDVFFGFSEGCVAIAHYFEQITQREDSDSLLAKGLLPHAVIFVGAPNPLRWDPTFHVVIAVPTWHVIGERDNIVPPEESRDFASFFCQEEGRSVSIGHHAHSVPQSSESANQLATFLSPFFDKKVQAIHQQESQNVSEELQEELDMMQMMFGEDNVTIQRGEGGENTRGGRFKTTITVRLHDGSVQANSTVTFVITGRYPDAVPTIALSGLPRSLSSRSSWLTTVLSEIRAEAQANAGSPMLMNVTLLLRDRVETALGEFGNSDDPTAEEDDEDPHNNAKRNWWDDDPTDTSLEEREQEVRAATAVAKQRLRADTRALASQWRSRCGGGSWRITIGLIGKPSAGKSTLYNAITEREQKEGTSAKVAAFPFTTIEPNIGEGRVPLRCPCEGHSACDAIWGHVVLQDGCVYRRHPVLVKDVAGLVKGAHRGHGKGNRFLNDLCDADVLIHVVDGAAATDADGCECAPGEGSAVDDVTWVRDEVHSWIFDNLCAKWSTIVKRPERLVGMFSGYRASQALVDAVLQRCGVKSSKDLTTIVPTWTRSAVHELVAIFVAMRFPLLVALNKSDMPSSNAIVKALEAQYPDETFVRISARSEWELLKLEAKGIVTYSEGTGVVRICSTAQPTEAERRFVAQYDATVYATLGSTGVQELLRLAVEQCHAVCVFPVQDALTAMLPENGSPDNGSGDEGCPLRLTHCLLMKPGSTVDDVFHAYCFSRTLNAVSEPSAVKLVRFELLELHRNLAERKVKILRKDDEIPTNNSIVRILTNKK